MLNALNRLLCMLNTSHSYTSLSQYYNLSTVLVSNLCLKFVLPPNTYTHSLLNTQAAAVSLATFMDGILNHLSSSILYTSHEFIIMFKLDSS